MSSDAMRVYIGEVPAGTTHYEWIHRHDIPRFYCKPGDVWHQWSEANNEWYVVEFAGGLDEYLLPIDRSPRTDAPVPATCTRLSIGGIEWEPARRVVVVMPNRGDEKYWDQYPESEGLSFNPDRYLQDVEQAIRDSGAEVIK